VGRRDDRRRDKQRGAFWALIVLTLTSILERTSRLHGEQRAILDPEGDLTWAQFAHRVARAAAVLRAFGIGAGERFGILCRNGFRNAEVMHAGYWMGAVSLSPLDLEREGLYHMWSVGQ
jgi:acyl-CoA synthetase (AMP-forming)/AMP-acid ligase II